MNYNDFTKIIEHEMRPALGCTDPIGIAFCAAVAAKHAEGTVKNVSGSFSANLIKNAAAVTIPKTGGLCGPRLATALGVFGGDPDQFLEVLKDLTAEQLETAKEFAKSDQLSINITDNDIKLYMEVTVTTDLHTATAIVRDDYINLTSLIVDGAEQLDKIHDADNEGKYRYDLLSIKTILDFADNAPFDEFKHIEQALTLNKKLAVEGMKGFDGCDIGKIAQGFMPSDKNRNLYESAALWTLAGVAARMDGCELPAMSNTGSGNQGIVCTMPVYGASLVLNPTHEKLVRATALSCLTAIYIKFRIGAISTVCGCTTACTGAGCAITYLKGGSDKELLMVMKNMFGNVAGMICDGAKTSCALKAATCVNAACLASELASADFALDPANGIVGKDEEETINNFVRTSTEGLSAMDDVILDIIMNK